MLLLLSLQVFSLVLLEKKIVMQSRDYSALTASILSLTKGSLSYDVRKLIRAKQGFCIWGPSINDVQNFFGILDPYPVFAVSLTQP